MKTRVIVTRRSHDYHAWIEGLRAKSGFGPTVEDAVDRLAAVWREDFRGGMEILFDYIPRALRATTEAKP